MTREDQIRESAYYKWAADGYPPSDGVSYWTMAEQEWETQSTLKKCGEIESILKKFPPSEKIDPVVKITETDLPNPAPLPNERDERTPPLPWRAKVLEFWKRLSNNPK